MSLAASLPAGRCVSIALLHWAAQTPAGVRVTDVWASKEALEQFIQEQVLPAGESVGMPEPEVAIIELHAYMVGR